jgi:hypothetical protein
MELANYPLKEIVLSKLLAKSVRTGNEICNVKSRMLSDLQLLLTLKTHFSPKQEFYPFFYCN